MNDRQLKYIIEIAKTENLTKAANNLYISQPSLSTMLDHVEKDLGINLFERKPNGMILTHAGECYIKIAQEILGNISDLEKQISDIRNNKAGKLTIGCPPGLGTHIFPHVIPRLQSKYPFYQFNLIESTVAELSQLLNIGQIDVALLYSPGNLVRVTNTLYFREPICIMAPSQFSTHAIPYDGETLYTLNDFSILNNKPFVIFKKNRALRQISDEIFAQHRINPRIILETDNWQTCLQMVEHANAFSILPFSPLEPTICSKKPNANRQFVPLVPDIHHERSVYFCYRDSISENQVLKSFIDYCQDLILLN